MNHSRNLQVSLYRLGTAAILGLVCFAAPGCKDKNAPSGGGSAGSDSTANSPADALVIGEYGSITGKEATFGKSTDEGIQLAKDEQNKAGGVRGKQIAIALEDDQSDSPKAETAVTRLIDTKHVLAILGEVASGSSLAAAPVCQKSGVPMISPSSTKPAVTEKGDYIFRVCFIDPFQAAVVARWALDGVKAKRVAIFTDNASPYSKGFSDNFETAFVKMGGQVVAKQSYNGGDKDFKGALTNIQQSHPDAIVVPGYYSDAGSIAKQARDLGITVPLLGGDGWDSQALFDTGGDAVNGCFFSDHMAVDDPNPAVKRFVDTYTARFGHKPDALAALGYDAAKLLFDAMGRAKSLERRDIRDAIAATKDFPGVTGKITIDANRNASKPAIVIGIKNKQFVKVAEIADPDHPMASGK